MRDLDNIREHEEHGDSDRTALLGFGGLALAGVLFAVGVFVGREGEAARTAPREDPLARLDALAGHIVDAGAPIVNGTPTAPGLDPLARLASAASPVAALGLAPGGLPGTQALAPVIAPVPVPAAALLDPTGRVRETLPPVARLPVAPANTQLRALAARADATPAGPPASAGSDGAFTLQVSSFRTAPGAEAFAQRLRERGYHAFVADGAASVNGVTWHRVRVGPFNTQSEVTRFRQSFETRERLPTFIVRREREARPAQG